MIGVGRAAMSGGTLRYLHYGAGFNSQGGLGINVPGANNNNSYADGGGLSLPQFVLSRDPAWSVPRPAYRSVHALQFQTAIVDASGVMWTAGGDDQFPSLARPFDVFSKRWFASVAPPTDGATWVKAQVGTEFVAALDSLGRIWTVGRNDQAGQILTGNSNVYSANIFYNTRNTIGLVDGAGRPYVPDPMPYFKDVWAGHRFGLALSTDNKLYGWGNNGGGQAGFLSPDGGGEYRIMGLYMREVDTRIGGVFTSQTWKKAVGGGYHGAGIDDQDRLWTWGTSVGGRRGPITGPYAIAQDNRPQIVACNDPSRKWIDVFLGEYCSFFLRDDGRLFATGENASGQLGVGNTTTQTDFVEVTAAGVPGWRFIHAEDTHTLGISLEGKLYGWGNNAFLRLGNASLTAPSYTTPQLISSSTDWIACYAMEDSSIAIRAV